MFLKKTNTQKAKKRNTFFAPIVLYWFCCSAVEHTRIYSAVIYLNVLSVTLNFWGFFFRHVISVNFELLLVYFCNKVECKVMVIFRWHIWQFINLSMSVAVFLPKYIDIYYLSTGQQTCAHPAWKSQNLYSSK